MDRQTRRRFALIGFGTLTVAILAYGAHQISSVLDYSFVESFGIMVGVLVVLFIGILLDDA